MDHSRIFSLCQEPCKLTNWQILVFPIEKSRVYIPQYQLKKKLLSVYRSLKQENWSIWSIWLAGDNCYSLETIISFKKNKRKTPGRRKKKNMMFLSGSTWKNFGEVWLWNGSKDFSKVFLNKHTSTIEDINFLFVWKTMNLPSLFRWTFVYNPIFLGITITWLRLLETLKRKAEFGQWFIWQKSNKVHQILIFQKDGYKL